MTTLNELKATLATLETSTTETTTTFSNVSPMRGRYQDSGQKIPKINVESINRAAREMTASSLSSWRDLTGKNTLLVSTCTTSHGHASWANHVRVIAIGKTGNAALYSGGHYAHGGSLADSVKPVLAHAMKNKGKPLDVQYVSPEAEAVQYTQNPHTPNKAQVFVSKSRTQGKTDSFKVWSWDGAGLQLLTVVKLVPISTAFDVVFNGIKTTMSELLDLPISSINFKYIGVISAPL